MSLFPPILTAAAMREADRRTIEGFGLPGFTLMETASRGAAARIVHRYGPARGKRIVLFCGKGNNGGDGLVVARVLYGQGAHLHVFTMGAADELSEDAGRNLRLLQTLAEHDATGRLTIRRYSGRDELEALSRADLYVDALLGTGLTDRLREPYDALVGWLNEQPEP
ncbi:MAG: NAD(P)H-hydrate epimerase, partial [Rhodothermales bacterium]|nr:NAD(P)H-hydrate epimerase [Rhodothermales bacterium]